MIISRYAVPASHGRGKPTGTSNDGGGDAIEQFLERPAKAMPGDRLEGGRQLALADLLAMSSKTLTGNENQEGPPQ